MVATKALISLCLLGVTRAAPQLGLPVGFSSPIAVRTTTSSSGANEQSIVSNVVTALQPSIASAVAAALRDISFSSSRTTTSNSGFNSGSNSFSSGSSSFNGGSSSSVAVNQEEEVTVRPNYNYQFKVADDDEQTYITHEEARDGDDVTGAYSYIDPNGALITVNYQAGAMGYTQTLDKKDGAVQIRSKTGSSTSGATSAVGNTASSSFGSSGSSSGSSFGSSSSRFGASNAGSSLTSTRTSSSSVGLDSSALVAQIISALQPQITSAVSTAVAGQQGQQTSFRTVTSNTGFATGANGDRLTPLFGN